MSLVLFIAGMPATGKSTFAQFLCQEYGLTAYDLENHPEGWALPELHNIWEADRAEFLRQLRQRHPGGVVLDWGFPPACLPWVDELDRAGARCIWLTGDLGRLRERFIARGGIPVESFDHQVAGVKHAGLPQCRAWPTVETLDADGRAPSWEEVWRRLEPSNSRRQTHL